MKTQSGRKPPLKCYNKIVTGVANKILLWSSIFVTLVAKKYQFSVMMLSVPDKVYDSC